MYQSAGYPAKRDSELLMMEAQRRGQAIRLRALRRATRRAERAAGRLDRAQAKTRQLRRELDVMS
jgi:hypothetical protein